ncbi:hypothetical protein IWQ56_000614 [Coemansia nantahalensis]|nr:hypothetical protein IWQ56_000614 [Coemansia nantahalensis]
MAAAVQVHKDIPYLPAGSGGASERHTLDIYVPAACPVPARHVRFLVVRSTGDELVNADQALAFAPQLVRAGYEDVTLAVRNLGLHDAAIGNREFLRMVAAFVGHQSSA